MAKGQLHSTGTVCKAEKSCPLEGDGGQHFDTIMELVEHTAEETGTDRAQILDSLNSGVSVAEVVSMARDGIYEAPTGIPVAREAKRPATIEIDLSFATSDTLKDRFLKNLHESGYPVTDVKTDGMGSYTVTVDAEDDPNDYSVLMAATSAVETAAYEIGYDEEDREDMQENLFIQTEVSPEITAEPTQSVSWSYEGNEFTSAGLTAEEAQAKQNELKAEGIEASID